jgi:hydroxymethylpyrimidine/phosphomethylpyrimidine kinase
MVEKGCKSVLLKGGHLIAEILYDVFARQGRESIILESVYISSSNVHGTGCTLSSAIATFVALGHDLPEAIMLAKNFVSDAILFGRDVATGRGPGPLNHFHDPRKMHLLQD